MIFGKTYEDRIALNFENRVKSRAWTKVFAIFPVRLKNGKFAWLQSVYRRKLMLHEPFEYSEIEPS
jgi:hypothetical protein